MNGRSRSSIAGGVVLLLALPIAAVALPPTPLTTTFGSGTAWNVATATSGVAADSGANGAWLNPASLPTARNELLGEGEVWGDISTVRGASPATMRYSAGAIHYLTHGERYSWALMYTPLSREELGLGIGQTEVVSRTRFNQYSLAISRRMAKNRFYGISAMWTGGASESGVLQQPQDGDTLLRANLYSLAFGFQQRSETWNYGIAIQTPKFGTLDIERSLNVVNRRETTSYDFVDAWTLRAGLSHRGAWSTRTLDLFVAHTGMRTLDGNSVTGEDWLVEISSSARAPLGELVDGSVGISWRLADPNGLQQLTFGFGGSYEFSPDLTLYGGAGILFGIGKNLPGTLLDDATPWVLRGGAIFHGE